MQKRPFNHYNLHLETAFHIISHVSNSKYGVKPDGVVTMSRREDLPSIPLFSEYCGANQNDSLVARLDKLSSVYMYVDVASSTFFYNIANEMYSLINGESILKKVKRDQEKEYKRFLVSA